MTMPIQIDTLAYAKKLEAGGVAPDQAEAHAQALSDVLADSIVVPGDLLLLKVDLLARIDIVKQELTARIDLSEQTLGTCIDSLKQEVGARLDLTEQTLGARIELTEQKLGARIDLLRQEFLGKLSPMRWMVAMSLILNIIILGKLFA